MEVGVWWYGAAWVQKVLGRWHLEMEPWMPVDIPKYWLSIWLPVTKYVTWLDSNITPLEYFKENGRATQPLQQRTAENTCVTLVSAMPCRVFTSVVYCRWLCIRTKQRWRQNCIYTLVQSVKKCYRTIETLFKSIHLFLKKETTGSATFYMHCYWQNVKLIIDNVLNPMYN